MQISLRAPDFSMQDIYGRYEAQRFLHDGVILTNIFRGENIAGLVSSNAAAFQALSDYVFGEYRARIEGVRGQARNLKFLPWAVEWDVDAFPADAIAGLGTHI
jgi:hypothetical protein